MITWELLIGKVLTLAIVPSGSSTFCFLFSLFNSMFGRNLTQLTNGANVITVPATDISLRTSRRDIDWLLLPTFPILAKVKPPRNYITTKNWDERYCTTLNYI